MRTILAAFALLAFASGYSLAAGKSVILTVTSAVKGVSVEFNREQLERLESREASMETPWTEGRVTFRGPLLKAVLQAAGAEGNRLVIKALNDYSAEIPIDDATDLPTILAMRANGNTLSVREKGPLFLIYPFDLKPELYNEKYFARSVWQISEIEVLD